VHHNQLQALRSRRAYRSRRPATVVFRNLGRLQLGMKTPVTVGIEDRGAYPLRYPVTFTRR
jgi:hypothetical protein